MGSVWQKEKVWTKTTNYCSSTLDFELELRHLPFYCFRAFFESVTGRFKDRSFRPGLGISYFWGSWIYRWRYRRHQVFTCSLSCSSCLGCIWKIQQTLVYWSRIFGRGLTPQWSTKVPGRLRKGSLRGHCTLKGRWVGWGGHNGGSSESCHNERIVIVMITRVCRVMTRCLDQIGVNSGYAFKFAAGISRNFKYQGNTNQHV